MSIVRSLARKFGTRSTQLVGLLWGDSFPFYYVSEYPRSGGTWLSRMVADYLDIPKPHHTVFPMGCSCVIQNHWGHSPRLRKVFYLYRDGRDVCISTYHFCLRGLQSRNPEVTKYFQSRIRGAERVTEWTHESCAELLPQFIESWSQRPMGCRINWNEHIRQWKNAENAVTLRYEDLLGDCHATMKKAIEANTGLPVDDDRLEQTIEKYSFEKQSGRKPGQEDPTSFMRKGIAGDWKNFFDRRTAETFHRHFGQTLIQLGYEDNEGWVEQVPTSHEIKPSEPIESR